jgi:hypothetical protein
MAGKKAFCQEVGTSGPERGGPLRLQSGAGRLPYKGPAPFRQG